MKKFLSFSFILLLSSIYSIAFANNPYNVDERDLRRAQRFAEYYTAFTTPGQLAQVTADNARQMHQQQMANQIGVPYEEYICQGNWQCIQQFELQRRQIQALQNQRIQVDYRYRY